MLSVTEEDEGEYSCRAVYTVPGYIEISPDDTITLSMTQDEDSDGKYSKPNVGTWMHSAGLEI